ncbi:MAG: YraN family protein [Phycisphaerales bacterium]
MMRGDRALAPHRAAGVAGERAAERHLRESGYRLLARNLDLGVGEADLVFEAPDRRTIVIVEVKARIASPDAPRPESSVTRHKQRKLAQLARAIAKRPEFADRPVRIDVVGVELDERGRAAVEIRHHENAVGV